MVSISGLVDAFVVEFAVAMALLGLSVIFRRRIRAKILNTIYFAANSEIQLAAKRVDTFRDTEDVLVDDFANDIYRPIRDGYRKEVTNPDYQGHLLEVTVENIPTDIVIKLEEEIQAGGMDISTEQVGYKLVIETDNDLRLGYRSVDSLREFENFAEDVSDIVKSQYFPETVPDTSVVQVELRNGVPAGIDEIEDSKLGLSARLRNSTLYMTFTEPRNLVEGVRKYFQPKPFRPT